MREVEKWPSQVGTERRKLSGKMLHRLGIQNPQPSHPLSSPSPPAFSLSQHQSFPISQFFPSGGQSIGVSASAPALPKNIQGLFPLGLTDLISLQSKGLSQESSLPSQFKSINSSVLSFIAQLWHPYMTTRKTIAFIRQTFVGKVLSLLFSTLSRLVIAFLPRSKHLLISWLNLKV